MEHRSGRVDQVVRQIASEAHGVVTHAELLGAGITREQIRQRLKRGSLSTVHQGVYRVGHSAPSLHADYLAAVKACGERAALCGPAAAHLWRLTKGSPPPPSVLAPVKRRVRGVATQRAVSLDPSDFTVCRRIPVTTVARTLVDLAGVMPEADLARACHEAGVLHRATPGQVRAVLARRPTSPGRATMERILRGGVRVTMSRLETRFLALLRDVHLPLPEANRPAGAYRVDCRWPERRLTVELDGYRFHSSRHAWEQDRRRERDARARGDEFRRYTYGDVCEEPSLMLSELRKLLGRRG